MTVLNAPMQAQAAVLVDGSQTNQRTISVRLPYLNIQEQTFYYPSYLAIVTENDQSIQANLVIDSNGEHFLSIPNTGQRLVVLFFNNSTPFGSIGYPEHPEDSPYTQAIHSLFAYEPTFLNAIESADISQAGIYLLGLDYDYIYAA